MEPVVVDASVLVAAALDAGPDGDWARALAAERHLIAPQLALIEAGNVVRRAELAGEITDLEATAGYRDIVDLPIELLAIEPFASRIWELRHHLTTYDACYVACVDALARTPGDAGRPPLPCTGSGVRLPATRRGCRDGLLTLRGRLDLLQRVVDQGGVVGLGEIAAEQLRGDH